MNSSKVFDVKTEINEIAALVAYVDEAILNDRVANHKINSEFASVVSGTFAADNADDFVCICNKSGAAIRNISSNEFHQLERIHGTDKAMRVIRLMQRQHIAPLWLVTDNKALNELSIIDPVGYFVYASSKLLVPYVPGLQKTSPSHSDEAARLAWLRAKHALWTNLQTIPKVHIFHANEIMRRFLAIINPIDNNIKPKGRHLLASFFSEIKLETLAENINDWINSVTTAIAEILKYEMQKGNINPRLSYDDIVKLKNIYGGVSAFRLQNKARKRTETETILDQLQDFMPDKPKRGDQIIHPSLPRGEIERLSKPKKKGNIQTHTGAFVINFGNNEEN